MMMTVANWKIVVQVRTQPPLRGSDRNEKVVQQVRRRQLDEQISRTRDWAHAQRMTMGARVR